MSSQCQGQNKNGRRCRNHVTPTHTLCYRHMNQIGKGSEHLLAMREAIHPRLGQPVNPFFKLIATDTNLLKEIQSHLKKVIKLINDTPHRSGIYARVTQHNKVVWEGILPSSQYTTTNVEQTMIIELGFPFRISLYRPLNLPPKHQDYMGSIIVTPELLEQTSQLNINEFDPHQTLGIQLNKSIIYLTKMK
jgi:hypothetical protein